jgi:fermentation-respiration switch protein FrsA (DUF1100 family)
MMGTEECFHYHQATKHIVPDKENKITLQTLFHAIRAEPSAFVTQISPKPLLMVIGLRDSLISPELLQGVFNTAGEPKRLLKLDCAHFGVYQGDFFEKNVASQIAFLNEHLVKTSEKRSEG